MTYLIPRRHRIFLYLNMAGGWISFCCTKGGPPFYLIYRAHHVGVMACRAVRELERAGRL